MAGDLTLRITVTEIETLQKNRLHVAGECGRRGRCGHQHFVAAVDQVPRAGLMKRRCELVVDVPAIMVSMAVEKGAKTDRKSTCLNSSHGYISYAVFCLKKKKDKNIR